MSDTGDLDDTAAEELLAEAVESSRAPEEYESEIKQLRKEAASRRVQNKEKEAELAEFRKWKESQKTELERVNERASQAEKMLSELRQEKLQLQVAREVGLDLDLADRIRGESEEDMLEDARKLVERAGTKKAAIDPFAGRRGGPVSAEASTGDLFRQWINNN